MGRDRVVSSCPAGQQLDSNQWTRHDRYPWHNVRQNQTIEQACPSVDFFDEGLHSLAACRVRCRVSHLENASRRAAKPEWHLTGNPIELRVNTFCLADVQVRGRYASAL